MELFLYLIVQIFRHIFSLGFLLYFLFAVAVVALMYIRLEKTKRQLYGVAGKAYGGIVQDVLKATALGFGGGVLGSILMVLGGVSVNNIGISYLWFVALVLFLVNPRYLCFSYAGGLLSISYLLTGFPRIEVPQLMGLVAILHLVESLLILASGHLGALPVYARQGDKTVGGFNLQRFWPIPLVVMYVIPVASLQSFGNSVIPMPDWWPLIRSPLEAESDVLYSLVPVVAALGYGDLALTDTPEGKSRWSAERLAVYSLLLLLLSILASHWSWLAWAAALFGPLGHEYLIIRGQQKELVGKPLYHAPERGVMILDVYPGSPAARMGLASGDVLFSINEEPVNTKWDVARLLSLGTPYLSVDYLRGGKLWRTQGRCPTDGQLGIIPVPETGDRSQVQFNSRGPLARLWDRVMRKKA